ncbi:MAG TPA: hypothetical protein ENK18_26045 [Deltaproteobacteria bacterium]|nr:hypothetical protein [Deltaproteobacteria bacterium]
MLQTPAQPLRATSISEDPSIDRPRSRGGSVGMTIVAPYDELRDDLAPSEPALPPDPLPLEPQRPAPDTASGRIPPWILVVVVCALLFGLGALVIGPATVVAALLMML